MSDKSWYVHKSKRTFGPFTEDELASKIAAGEFIWLDLAIQSGGVWRILEQIPEMRRRFGLVLDEGSPDLAALADNQWVFLREVADGERRIKDMRGPFSPEEARSRLYAGELSFSDRVWRKGMKSWGRVGDFEEFAEREAKSGAVDVIEFSDPDARLAADLTALEKRFDREELFASVTRLDASSQLKSLSEIPADAAGEDLVAMPEWMKYLGALVMLLAFGGSAGAREDARLEIVGMKLNTDEPTLVFNGVGSEPLTINITGLSGEILELPSYRKSLTVAGNPAEAPKLALAELKLPRGQYRVDVVAGEARAKQAIFLGVNDAAFKEALSQHRKMIAAQQQREKKTLFYTAREFSTLASRLEKHLRSGLKTEWSGFYASWRRGLREAAAPFEKVLSETENSARAYPDHLQALKELADQLSATASAANSVLSQSREIASREVRAAKVEPELQALKALKVQRLQPLLREAATLSSSGGREVTSSKEDSPSSD